MEVKEQALRSVLGIDAAWTVTQPSGVALVVEKRDGWHLVKAASSYDEFVDCRARTGKDQLRPRGSVADAGALLSAAETLALQPVDLVAIDMPLSLQAITSRRLSDNLVSSAYGARHCGTHSPSAERPGKISDVLRQSFDALGYPLATGKIIPPCLIEVDPHPALIELMAAARRLPYKQSRMAAY